MTDAIKIREGDTVLVRCKVQPLTLGSTRALYPGIKPGKGFSVHAADLFEIVKVEQAFRVGDRVQFLNKPDRCGEIVALSPEGVEPKQAWIRDPVKWPLETADLRSLRRVET